MQPPSNGGGARGGSRPGKPNGKYTRTNRRSQQGVEADMMNKLMTSGASREGAY
jgi:hypothetical protein